MDETMLYKLIDFLAFVGKWVIAGTIFGLVAALIFKAV